MNGTARRRAATALGLADWPGCDVLCTAAFLPTLRADFCCTAQSGLYIALIRTRAGGPPQRKPPAVIDRRTRAAARSYEGSSNVSNMNEQFTRQAQDFLAAAKDARIPENVQAFAGGKRCQDP